MHDIDSLADAAEAIGRLEQEIRKRIVGLHDVVRLLLVCLFAAPGRNSHLLVEGVPGLAKTLLLKTMAEALKGDFRRISFAADLLPRDVVGVEDFNRETQELRLLVKGPLFTNFLLADELNRARTTSKASILEPMEEGQVTTELGGTYRLPEPFMVVATQNPVEEEGTYMLGRAEQDRFAAKVLVGYPDAADEPDIIRLNANRAELPPVAPVLGAQDVLRIRETLFHRVQVADAIIEKAAQIVAQTRPSQSDVGLVKEYVDEGQKGGASPRAAIHMIRLARVHAVLQGRDFVSPEDVGAVLLPVLRHRLVLRPEVRFKAAQGDEDAIMEQIAGSVYERVWEL